MTPQPDHRDRDHDRPRAAPALEQHRPINADELTMPVGDRSARQAFIHARVTCLMAMWRLKQRAGG